MKDDPISQLSKTDYAVLNVLQSAFDLNTLLKSVLENAIKLVGGDWGMIVLNSYSSISSYASIVRLLPDMRPQYVEDSGVSLLIYSLTCDSMQQKTGRKIPDVTVIPLAEKQDVLRKYLSPWALDSLSKSTYTEEPVTLIIVPIFVSQDETSAIVVSKPLSAKPFVDQNLADVERFVSLISNYANVFVLLGKSAKKNSELMQVMASEIKNPLVMIRGYTELLLKSSEIGELTETQTRFLEVIQRSVERINKMLNNLVDLAKLEAEWLRFDNTKLDIREILATELENLKSIYYDKNQKVILDSTNEITLHADRYIIEKVVEIMIRNASSYSPKDSEIRVSMKKELDKAYISVSDNGIGLTDGEKNRLFQQFYRSDRKEVREQAGIGLDLFIAKQLIEKMGGQIGAEGSVNQGSTFWFTLPIKEQ